MKRFLSFLTALLLTFLPMNAIRPVFDGDEGDPEEIELYNQNGENPTSINLPTIVAHKIGTSIIIGVSNYYGNVGVIATGMGGHIVSNQNLVNGSDIIILDISSLTSGNYTLLVLAGQLYQGSFTVN